MYRTQLAKALIGTYYSRKRLSRPQLTPSKKFSPAHFPTKQEYYRRYHYFRNYNNKRRHDTAWFCKDCPIYLCHKGKEDDCFQKGKVKKQEWNGAEFNRIDSITVLNEFPITKLVLKMFLLSFEFLVKR